LLQKSLVVLYKPYSIHARGMKLFKFCHQVCGWTMNEKKQFESEHALEIPWQFVDFKINY